MSTRDADLQAVPGAVDPVSTEVAEVAQALEVDPAKGLTAAQVQERLASTGPNRLAEGKTESGFRAFLRQYEDFMQIVLLVAAVVNQIVTGRRRDHRGPGRPDRLQRRDRTAPGGQGRGERQGARSDDEDHRAGTTRRAGDRDRRRRARSGRRRPGRGRQPGAGRRPRAWWPPRSRSRRQRSPGRACRSGKSRRTRARRRRPAGRPDLHGVHEHLGHARPRRADRDRDRAWTPRSGTSPTCWPAPRPTRRRCRSSSTA